jgi:hydrogenase maturation protease
MGKFSGHNEPVMTARLRVLCLGNELLADDALGFVVADRLLSESSKNAGEDTGATAGFEVVKSSLSGLALIDEFTNASCLIVIDSVQTGNAPPGTLHIWHEDELKTPAGPSPHYFGIFETLRLARELRLPAPEHVIVLAVEAADCITLGGPMHPAVLAAVPKVVDRVREIAFSGGCDD